jgi:DNA-binding GntR family transcriptional regulator
MDMADGDAALDSAQPRRTPKPAATARRGATISAAIYRQLRTQIVSMARRPGDVIAEKDIARQYGVSRTPVREALLQLAGEGLVDIFPQVGTFVSRISMAALPEALVIRKALEEAAVRYAATRATASQILRLQASLAQQREADDVGDFDGFHQGDELFHALIAEAAGYPRFWTLTQQVKVQVDRCRRLTLPAPGRMSRVIAEHQDIVDAIVARDPDRAVRGMAVHIQGLGSGIADVRKMNPRYFIDHAGEPAAEPA